MKPHSKEMYEQWRAFNERQREGVEPEHFTCAEQTVYYTVVHIPEGQRPFPYPVVASFPSDQKEYEVAVSDDVPSELRGLWAWHEYYDFAVLGYDADHRCLRSEMALAATFHDTSALYHRYLLYRIEFYHSLGSFMERDIEQKGAVSEYDAADVEGCHEAADFLLDHLDI